MWLRAWGNVLSVVVRSSKRKRRMDFKLQKLALKVALVMGFLLGVYVFDLVLDSIWPSDIPDWVL